jgi:hypothetical protein
VIINDQKCKGGFETYSFIINKLIKHADAKAFNRHIVTGCMKPGDLILVCQEALGLLLWENYGAPWEQLVNAMNDVQQTVPGNEALKTKYTNLETKEILGERRDTSGRVHHNLRPASK